MEVEWSSCLVELRPGGERAPFFCVHASGGSAFSYATLAPRLPADRAFFALEAAGLDGEAPPLDRAEDMAHRYRKVVEEIRPAGPYHLGGWSMGGVIALELARQLRERGRPVGLLALLDTHLPDMPLPASDELLMTFVEELAGTPGREVLDELLPGLRTMGPDEQCAVVTARLERHGALPLGMEQSEVHDRFSVFAANMRAFHAYHVRPFPEPVHVMQAATSGDLVAKWQPYALGGITGVTVPGDHFSMLRPPDVDVVGAELSRALRELA